jgi:invasion protein IalB
VPKPVAAKPIKQAQAPIPALPSAVPAKQLPNGASSITESYGSWTVSCRINDGQKLCSLAQAQGNKQTGQRTFGIEFLTPKGGKIDGTVLMPFGLKLDAGATTKLDDKDFGQPLHFSTCIPDGCLLPVSFSASATEALQKGTALSVTSIGLSNGQAVTFSISLDGFPAGLKRVSDLGG